MWMKKLVDDLNNDHNQAKHIIKTVLDNAKIQYQKALSLGVDKNDMIFIVTWKAYFSFQDLCLGIPVCTVKEYTDGMLECKKGEWYIFDIPVIKIDTEQLQTATTVFLSI